MGTGVDKDREGRSGMPTPRAGAKPKIVGTSPMAYIDIGKDHWVPIEAILMVMKPKGREAVRLRQAFSSRGMLLDFTTGRRTASMLMLVPGGYLVQSPRSTDALIRAMQSWYFEKTHGPKGKR